MPSQFTKDLENINNKIEEIQLKLIELDFQLRYNKVLLKKLETKKIKILRSYSSY